MTSKMKFLIPICTHINTTITLMMIIIQVFTTSTSFLINKKKRMSTQCIIKIIIMALFIISLSTSKLNIHILSLQGLGWFMAVDCNREILMALNWEFHLMIGSSWIITIEILSIILTLLDQLLLRLLQIYSMKCWLVD